MNSETRRDKSIGALLERLGDYITSVVGTMWAALATGETQAIVADTHTLTRPQSI